MESLKEVAKKLRQLPSLDAGLPTLALVGAPNVGKSSLVQVLSSGTPEVGGRRGARRGRGCNVCLGGRVAWNHAHITEARWIEGMASTTLLVPVSPPPLSPPGVQLPLHHSLHQDGPLLLGRPEAPGGRDKELWGGCVCVCVCVSVCVCECVFEITREANKRMRVRGKVCVCVRGRSSCGWVCACVCATRASTAPSVLELTSVTASAPNNPRPPLRPTNRPYCPTRTKLTSHTHTHTHTHTHAPPPPHLATPSLRKQT